MRTEVQSVHQRRKLERLALIKERYKKVVLQPRHELDKEFRDAFGEDLEFDLN